MTQHCYKHPDTETGLRCGSCDRPICVKCVVQHPVGIRCPECGRPTKIPAFEVTPTYYARAIAAAVGIGIGGVVGLVLVSILLFPLGPISYYARLLALVGVGYLMGRGVSLAVNRKRGRGLQWVAGVGVVVAFLLASSWPIALFSVSLYSLLAVGFAMYVAINQLRI